MKDTINRLPAVKQFSGLGKTSIYNGVAAGTFPAPLKIGLRAVGWRTSDLTQWLNSRAPNHAKE
jgi:prophage regulatory protein